MYLTKEENEMLEGKYGHPVQKSMEILVGLGECYDAERMLPITSAHILPALIQSSSEARASIIKNMADKGAKFRTFTTANPQTINPETYRDKDVGISEKLFSEQTAVNNNLHKMGAFLSYTCTPYLVGNVPRFRQHVAFSEVNVITFANSVLGARTNREGGPSALAAAICGRTPEYGYHLDENRYGDLEISITVKLNGIADFGTLGEFVGRVAGDKVPVLTGISPAVSWDELTQLGAQICIAGSVALCHVVGVTPEASTEEAAFGPRKKGRWPRFEFGEKELSQTEGLLSEATGGYVDLVVLGCPHTSVAQLKEIAGLLSGKKLKSGLELWIMTSRIVMTFAQNMGYIDVIEATGARVLGDVCPLYIMKENFKKHGPQVVASDSARHVSYMPGLQGVMPHYGSTKRCIEAAISGIWR
ncbi:aconitase X [Chloroflexota bacterium]